MGNPLSKPAKTVGRAITDSADQLDGTASRAADQFEESAGAAKEAAKSAQNVFTKVGDASDAYKELAPTADKTLHSFDATSEVVKRNIPALAQSCQGAAGATVVGAAALASTAQSSNAIAGNSTRMAATKEASLVIRAADGVPDRARGFLKDLKSNQHGVFIPATEIAYLMCCNDFTIEEQKRHLARTLIDAIEKVKNMRRKGVLQKEVEVVYYRDAIIPTCVGYSIWMPEGMGRFIIRGSTDLHGHPYIQLKGVYCDLDSNYAPMGKIMNLGWQPQHVALEEALWPVAEGIHGTLERDSMGTGLRSNASSGLTLYSGLVYRLLGGALTSRFMRLLGTGLMKFTSRTYHGPLLPGYGINITVTTVLGCYWWSCNYYLVSEGKDKQGNRGLFHGGDPLPECIPN